MRCALHTESMRRKAGSSRRFNASPDAANRQTLSGAALAPVDFPSVDGAYPPRAADEARRRRAEGATLAELARSYGVGKSTISRLTG